LRISDFGFRIDKLNDFKLFLFAGISQGMYGGFMDFSAPAMSDPFN